MPSRQSNQYNKLHSGKNLAEVPLKMKQEHEKKLFEILVNIDQKVPETENMEKFVPYIRKLLEKWDTGTMLRIFEQNPRFFYNIINTNHRDILDQIQSLLTQKTEEWMKGIRDGYYNVVIIDFLWILDEIAKKPQDIQKIEELKWKTLQDITERKKYELDNQERNSFVEKKLAELNIVEEDSLV